MSKNEKDDLEKVKDYIHKLEVDNDELEASYLQMVESNREQIEYFKIFRAKKEQEMTESLDSKTAYINKLIEGHSNNIINSNEDRSAGNKSRENRINELSQLIEKKKEKLAQIHSKIVNFNKKIVKKRVEMNGLELPALKFTRSVCDVSKRSSISKIICLVTKYRVQIINELLLHFKFKVISVIFICSLKYFNSSYASLMENISYRNSHSKSRHHINANVDTNGDRGALEKNDSPLDQLNIDISELNLEMRDTFSSRYFLRNCFGNMKKISLNTKISKSLIAFQKFFLIFESIVMILREFNLDTGFIRWVVQNEIKDKKNSCPFSKKKQSIIDEFYYRNIITYMNHNFSALYFFCACGDLSLLVVSIYCYRYMVQWLREVIKPPLSRIVIDNVYYELDPSYISKNDNLEANIREVKSLFTSLVGAMLKSESKFPIQVIRIFIWIFKEVKKEYPEVNAYNLVGELFLSCFGLSLVGMEWNQCEIKSERPSLTFAVLLHLISHLVREELFDNAVESYLHFNERIKLLQSQMRNFITVQLMGNDSLGAKGGSEWGAQECRGGFDGSTVGKFDYFDQLSSSMQIFDKNALVAQCDHLDNLNNHSIYTCSFNYSDYERFMVLIKQMGNIDLAHVDENDVLVNEFINYFLFNQNISKSILKILENEQMIQNLAEALINLSIYRDPTCEITVSLFMSFISTEFAKYDEIRPEFLGDFCNNFSGRLYSFLVQNYGESYHKAIVLSILELIKKSKLTKFNRKNALTISNLIETFSNSFHLVDNVFWKISNILATKLIDPGPALFLNKMISARIVALVQTHYKLSLSDDKLSTLKTIQNFLNRTATLDLMTSIDTNHFNEINQILRETHDKWNKAFFSWSISSFSNTESKKLIIDWNQVRKTLQILLDILKTQVLKNPLFENSLSVVNSSQLYYSLGNLHFSMFIHK